MVRHKVWQKITKYSQTYQIVSEGTNISLNKSDEVWLGVEKSVFLHSVWNGPVNSKKEEEERKKKQKQENVFLQGLFCWKR